MPGTCTMILTSLGGDVALANVQEAWNALEARHPGELELQKIVRDELDEAVLRGEADVAVHRVEHLPPKFSNDLVLAAVLPRRWFTDALVADVALRDLPRSARIATSDVRRRAMLLRARPDLKILETHGDVRTRVQRRRAEGYDGLVLSTAHLKRLGVEDRYEELDPKVFVPTAGQGAIGCVCRQGSRFEEFLEGIDDGRTRTEVEIERAVLRALGGSTEAPVGVHATKRGDRVTVHAIVLSLDGRRAVAETRDLTSESLLYEADEFAERLKGMGADVLLEQSRRALR